MGRSAALSTVIRMTSRPSLYTTGSSAKSISPGIMASAPPSDDRLVHGDELGAVGERRLDLDVVDHLGDAVHDVVTGEQLAAGGHEFGDRAPVPGAFENVRGDQRDRLGMIELET